MKNLKALCVRFSIAFKGKVSVYEKKQQPCFLVDLCVVLDLKQHFST